MGKMKPGIRLPLTTLVASAQEQVKQALIGAGDLVEVPAGTQIIRRGEHSNDLYVVQRGRFEIVDTRSRPEVVLDAVLADASTRWPSELLAASPALARTPVSARGSWLSSAWFRFAALFLAFGAMCACAPTPARKVGAAWQPMDPPRAGLRCWFSYYPGNGVSYCEPDPTATFGASP
jgi:hypothetical protein